MTCVMLKAACQCLPGNQAALAPPPVCGGAGWPRMIRQCRYSSEVSTRRSGRAAALAVAPHLSAAPNLSVASRAARRSRKRAAPQPPRSRASASRSPAARRPAARTDIHIGSQKKTGAIHSITNRPEAKQANSDTAVALRQRVRRPHPIAGRGIGFPSAAGQPGGACGSCLAEERSLLRE